MSSIGASRPKAAPAFVPASGMHATTSLEVGSLAFLLALLLRLALLISPFSSYPCAAHVTVYYK